MFNNPYMQGNYNPQQQFNNIDQNYLKMLDKEEENIKNMRSNYMNRYQQPTSFNQTIQLAPQNNGIKIVNSIDDVQKELAIVDTPFINPDYSILWIKNAKGEIRTFDIQEVKPKDEKDLIIEDLKTQISQLNNQIKEMNTYEPKYSETSNEYESKQLDEPIKNETTSNVSNVKSSKPKSR